MTKNLVTTYCIQKGKHEATDGAQVDSKGAHITQQWRIVNVIFSIKNLHVYMAVSLSQEKKKKETPRHSTKILTYKKSVENPIKIFCTIE